MSQLKRFTDAPRRVLLAVALSLLITPMAVPTAMADDEIKEYVTLTGDHKQQQFLMGRRVDISKANVDDDIFAAARDVAIETVSAKHITAAGMSLSLKDVTANDLIVGGGQLELSGTVSDDVLALVCPFCPFGGRLNIAKNTQIGDDARLAGRDITVDGRVGGNLFVAGQFFKLSGEVVGNARIEAEEIVLVPGARIGGDLLYVGPTKPEVPDGVTIAGQIKQVGTELPFARGVPSDWIWYAVLAVFGVLVAFILLGAALQIAVPGLLSSASATAVERPWASLGRGLAVAILVPGFVALLMVTIVGAPIGMVTMASFFVLLALAFVSITYCIGQYLRGLFSSADASDGLGSRVLWTTVGILIMVFVGLIPFLGWALLFLAMIAGLGAVVTCLGPLFRRPGALAAPA